MTKVSLNAAAKLAGVSKSTISKALKTGILSYAERTTAGYQIDISELARVYPTAAPNILKPVANQSPEPLENTSNLSHSSQLLMLRLEAAEEQQRRTDAMLEDIREDRDRWRQQATALLTDQRSLPVTADAESALPTAPTAKGFWSRLFGKTRDGSDA